MTQSERSVDCRALLASAFGYVLFEQWPQNLPELLSDDDRFLYRAIQLSSMGHGRTHPNPAVGSIVAKPNGEILSEAYHEFAGGLHAEAKALVSAGDLAQDSHLYVSLEPCTNFSKRTPACIDGIVRSRVARVRIATIDPNPKVNGQGIIALADRGVDAKLTGNAFIQNLATSMIRGFSTLIQSKRPYIILKIAQSADGMVASAKGVQTQITSDLANHIVHRLRNACDAIAVGRNTVDIDNPRLTARLLNKHDHHEPLRVVFDSSLSIATSASVFAEKNCVVFHDSEIPKKQQDELSLHVVNHYGVSKRENGLDVRESMLQLGALGVSSLLVEGGPHLWASFLNAGLVDEVWFFKSPRTLGKDGVPAFLKIRPEVDAWINAPGHQSYTQKVGVDELTILRIQKPL